jgi:flagellar protein FlaF
MVSSLLTGAIGVLLILITGYVVVGGILTIGETIINTQTDVNELQQKNLNSRLMVLYTEKTPTSFLIGVSNNGSTYFGGSDFGKMDVYIGYTDNTVTKESILTHYTIINDRINRNMWDESEIVNMSYSGLGKEPVWVRLATPNGATVSTNL